MTRYIYLHGFASGPGSKKARYFAARFQELGLELHVPDLAEGRFETLTLTGQLKVVERAADGAPVVLIGSSLGGYLAALYAARHADVKQIVLIAPGFGFARRWPQTLGANTLAEWERAGHLNFYHYGAGKELPLGYQLISDGLTYEDYPAVTQPCLIFHGKNDDVVPAGWSAEFAQGKPNVELLLEESDHELLNILEPMWLRMQQFLF